MADLVDEVFGNAPEPEQAPIAEPAPEPVAEPEKQPEPIPEPKPEPKDEERHIPLRVGLDWRDEAKEAKRERDELRRKLQERETPAQVPDSYDDPEGYNAYLESRMEERFTQERFRMSDLMAKQVHGEDAVTQAVEWAKGKAQADPMFAASYMRDPNPIDWIVRQHQRDAVVSAIPTDVKSLDELIEREIARRGLSAPIPAAAPVVAAPAVKPAAPPRSIASDAPASAPTNSNPDADFMAIFNKR